MFDINFSETKTVVTNFLQWAIKQLGPLKFILIIGGIFYFFSIKALLINLRNEDYERALLVGILIVIVLGGLIGFAIEFQ